MEEYNYYFLDKWIELNKWYFICISVFQNKTLNLYFQGKYQISYQRKYNKTSVGDSVSVGFVDPLIKKGRKFVGNITQFNMWSKPLSSSEILNITLCRSNPTGDVISWGKDQWINLNASFFDLPLSDLCSLNSSNSKLLLLPHMDFFKSTFFCESIGGELYTPKTYEEIKYLILKFRNLKPDCIGYWVGISDKKLEGIWRYTKSGNRVGYLPWSFDEPNGLHLENCGGVDFEGIVDDECSIER